MKAATINRKDITITGTIPLRALPGKQDSFFVGKPKKYLKGPDFVISQETAKVPIVESMRTMGNDPKIK